MAVASERIRPADDDVVSLDGPRTCIHRSAQVSAQPYSLRHMHRRAPNTLKKFERYWPSPESACRRVSCDKHEAESLLGLTPYDWTFPESACRRGLPEFIMF
jgi:hypothetical protein